MQRQESAMEEAGSRPLKHAKLNRLELVKPQQQRTLLYPQQAWVNFCSTINGKQSIIRILAA